MRLLTLLALGWLSTVALAENWPQFRGPTGQGHANVTDVPAAFSDSKNVAWKAEIPGQGWSSPVIWGDQIWLTTAKVDEVPNPTGDKRLKDEAPIPRSVADNLRMYAICVDRQSGRIIHNQLLMTAPHPAPLHTMNSYASPTPVIEDGRVYCCFGTNGTAGVDTQTGEVIWTNRELTIDHGTGAGSSPILWNDLLILHCDGKDHQYVVALDKATGKIVWKTNRSGRLSPEGEMKKAFGTPLVRRINDRDVLISPAANWTYGYDPLTGEELWRYEYGMLGFSNVPGPLVDGNVVFICTGFMKPQLQAIRLPAGDSSEPPHLEWSYRKQVPTVPSPVLVDDKIYFVSDNDGILTCVSAKTGKLVWRQRIGGKHAASLLYAADKIYIADRDGMVHVIAPGSEYRLIAKNQLPDGILATPIAVDDTLFIRTRTSLYRIENLTR